MRMRDKTVVLFRGLSKLGLAAAAKMLAEGAARVVILDQSERLTQDAVELIDHSEGKVELRLTDPLDPEALKNSLRQIKENDPAIHALVNCQDAVCCGGLMDTSEEDWQRMLDGNLTELFIVCHEIVPEMKAAGYGRIVNMTALAGRQDDGSGIAACAMKMGIMGFTRGLAMELRECGITVNSIAVGDLTEQGIMDAAVHAIIYLAGDEASWTTGDCMDVNGGRFMQN